MNKALILLLVLIICILSCCKTKEKFEDEYDEEDISPEILKENIEYIELKNRDIGGFDLNCNTNFKKDTKTNQDLYNLAKKECDKNSKCIAFNVLKNEFKHATGYCLKTVPYKAENIDFYIKNN